MQGHILAKVSCRLGSDAAHALSPFTFLTVLCSTQHYPQPTDRRKTALREVKEPAQGQPVQTAESDLFIFI